MIGTSRTEAFFINACIGALHYLAPTCILYCVVVVALYGLKATRLPVPLFIETVAIAETVFFLVVYLPYKSYLQSDDAIHPPTLPRSGRRDLFERCERTIPDHEAYFRKWFLGAELKDIRRENMEEFFLWAFFNRAGEPGEDAAELNEYIDVTEMNLPQKFAPGRGRARCLRLTLDPINMLHRSLTWYSCIGFVDFFSSLNMWRKGFTLYRTRLSRFFHMFPFRFHSLVTPNVSPVKYSSYWYRPHTSKTKAPVLFIHGIGVGLYPYVNFLSEMNSVKGLESPDPNDQVGIIALEIMPVSLRITHPALGKDTMCREVAAILKHHGWSNNVLVTHSYGSVIATHLLESSITKDLFCKTVLIDPVSILLHLPDVAYNFTRRKAVLANELQLWYFASMDMGVAHALGRHFFWNENELWKEDMEGKDITVALSGQDIITDTRAVREHLSADTAGFSARTEIVLDERIQSPISSETDGLSSKPWTGSGTEVLWFEELDHAQVFDKASTRKVLIDVIREYCKDASLSSSR